MATHDYVLANQSGSSFRTDLNNALAAVVSNNSNATEPSTKYAYELWADTNSGYLKIRNAANNGWVSLFKLDGTDIHFVNLSGSTNNTVCTVTGADAIQGEANLQFDGTGLGIGRAPTAGYLLDLASTGAPTFKIQDIDGTEQYLDHAHNSGESYWVSRNNTTKGTYRWYQHDGSLTTAMRIDSSGRLLLGTTTEGHSTSDDFTIATTDSTGITIRSAHNCDGNIYFSDGTSGSAEYMGYLQYNHTDDKLSIGANAQNKVQVLANGNVNISDGDLVIGTAGHGIDFSATGNSSGTTTSELFDDYEYGSFIPTISSSGGSSTVAYATNARNGFYIKQGRLVTIFIDLTTSSWSGGSGGQIIQNLPFTKIMLSGQDYYYEGVGEWNVTNAMRNSKPTYAGYIGSGGTQINMYVGDAEASSVAPVNVAGRVAITFSYTTSS